MKSSIEIFLHAAREDEPFLRKLEKQLQTLLRYGLIDAIWHSQDVVPGTVVDQEIYRHLNASQIIVLLISPYFLSSDHCYKIMQQSMDREEKGEARVIPVLLRPVDWKDARFGRLRVLPANEKPITTWSNIDAAMYDVAAGVRRAVEDWTGKTAPNLPATSGGASSTAVALGDPTMSSFILVRTLTEHLGPVASVAFSSDGELLVSDSWEGPNSIRIWNRDASSVLYTLSGHVGAVYSVVFSPDVRIIASGSDDGTIKIWDTRTGREVRTLRGHGGPVSSVALSADMLASGSDDGTIKIWDTRTGREVRTLRGHGGPVSSVTLSADSKIAVSGGYDKTIKTWDIQSGKVITSFAGHTERVSSVILGTDLRTLLSGSYDKTIKIWNLPSGQVQLTLEGHTGPVSSIALAPDAKTLVSGSHDKTIMVWDIATGQLLRELTGHAEAVLSVAFHPEGNTIASGGFDKTIRIWQKPPARIEDTQPPSPFHNQDSVRSDTPEQETPLPPKRSIKRGPCPPTRKGLFIKRDCPACTQEFYPGDCEVVSSVPELRVLEQAPKNVLRRFFARIWPKPLTGTEYTLKLACRRCPHCGYLLPFNIERVRNVSVVVLGDIGSGKSHYIAALIHQMQREWATRTSGRMRLTCLTPEVENTFMKHYLTPLFSDRRILEPTKPAIELGKEPLIYELALRESADRPPTTINLILYDSAGEDYATPERLVQYSRHLFHASGIIFLADPTAMHHIRVQVPAHELQSTPVTQRTVSDFFNPILHMVERFSNASVRADSLPIPIAIAVSKADLLQYIIPIQARPNYWLMYRPAYDGKAHPDDIEHVDQEVRSIIDRYGEGALLGPANNFSNVQFFAVSATGSSPDASGVYSSVEPHRCLDPLLWLLYQLCIIEADRAKPNNS